MNLLAYYFHEAGESLPSIDLILDDLYGMDYLSNIDKLRRIKR